MAGQPFHTRFLVAWQAFERLAGHRVDSQEFASALGVSRPSVSVWQKASEPPPHDRILVIARACGVDPGWLAYGDDSQAPMAKVWDAPNAMEQQASTGEVRPTPKVSEEEFNEARRNLLTSIGKAGRAADEADAAAAAERAKRKRA